MLSEARTSRVACPAASPRLHGRGRDMVLLYAYAGPAAAQNGFWSAAGSLVSWTPCRLRARGPSRQPHNLPWPFPGGIRAKTPGRPRRRPFRPRLPALVAAVSGTLAAPVARRQPQLCGTRPLSERRFGCLGRTNMTRADLLPAVQQLPAVAKLSIVRGIGGGHSVGRIANPSYVVTSRTMPGSGVTGHAFVIREISSTASVPQAGAASKITFRKNLHAEFAGILTTPNAQPFCSCSNSFDARESWSAYWQLRAPAPLRCTKRAPAFCKSGGNRSVRAAVRAS